MTLSSALVLAATVTILLSLVAGASPSKERYTLPGFFYADHKLNLGAILNLLLSSPFSLNGLLYQTFLGYAIGPAAVLTQVAWCASYLWLNAYRKRIQETARYQTMHGVIGTRFGKEAERAAAIATIVGFTLQIGWEVIVGASIFSAGFGSTRGFYWVAAVSAALIAAVYTILGGLRGNARANTIQNIIAAAALIMLTIFLVRWSGSHPGEAGPWDSGSLVRLFGILGIAGVITNIVFSLLWQFVDMSTWQNLAATDRRNDPGSKSLIGSAVLIFIFPGLIGTVLGMYLRSAKGLDPNTIMPMTIELLLSNPYLLVFVIIGLVCAALSTVDGLLLAIAHAFTFDLKERENVRTVMDWYSDRVSKTSDTEAESTHHDEMPTELARQEQKVFSVARYSLLAAALTGSVVTVLLTQYARVNIFDLVYIVVVAQLVLFPVVFRALRNPTGSFRRGAWSIWSGLIIGTVLVIGGIVSGQSDRLQWIPVIALIVATAVLGRKSSRDT